MILGPEAVRQSIPPLQAWKGSRGLAKRVAYRRVEADSGKVVGEKDAMRSIELTLVIVAAAGLALWRGLAMYRQTFQRNRL